MARYLDAINFIAWNDDTEFLKDDPPTLSVTGSLVAYLFKKQEALVLADLSRAVKRRDKELEAERRS